MYPRWANKDLALHLKLSKSTVTKYLAPSRCILHTFNTGTVRELVSSTTNVTPAETFRGKWILLDMSPVEWGDIGNFVAAGWKYLTQIMVLHRLATESSTPVCNWVDEEQMFVNSHETYYLAQCRSHRG